ncbi:MAG: hypothetical protein ACC700_17290, partial [Anaerolineales bacterium]
MTNKTGPLPPYASPKTFNTFLSKLGRNPPQVIDRSVWGSWMSGASANQVMNAMRFLNLVSTDNRPHEYLRQLLRAEDAERKKALKEILEGAYPWLFDGSIDLKSATAKQLDDKFREQGARSNVLPKCIRFFTQLAQDAEIPLSEYITKRKRARGPVKKKKPVAITAPSAAVQSKADKAPSREALLVEAAWNKFPDFDPTWSEETQVSWMERFERLFEKME